LIVDVHAHLGRCRQTRINGDADFLIKTADRLGIDKLCISSLEAIMYDDFDRGNMEVAEATKRYRGRIFGLVVANPRFGEEAVKQVRKYVREYEFRGVKLYYPDPNDPDLPPVIEEAIKCNVPLKIHADTDALDSIALQFPNATIIMCHMGGRDGRDWLKGIRIAKKRDNVLLDSTTTVTDAGMIEEAVRVVGPERVVYGSDMPLLNPVTQLAKIKTADIDEKSKKLILGENTVRILRLVG
jgi:predicted TIM-barrel fold metal-dependent hydrolase